MDDQLLLHVYHRLFDPGKVRHPAGCTFSDSIVVLIHFLAALRDRWTHWAIERRNWPLWMRRLAAPSYSQLMRRLATPPALRLIEELNDEFRAALPRGAEKVCDGKPLAVGGFSKDPDAGAGRLPGGGWGRGYEVHVVLDAASGAVDAFAVTPLGAGEPTVARERLVPRLVDLRGSVLRGDSNYDSNPLYHAVAGRGGAGRTAGRDAEEARYRPRPSRPPAPRPPACHRGTGALARGPARAPRSPRPRRAGPGAPDERAVRARAAPELRAPPAARVSLWVTAKVALYHLYLILRRRRTLAA